jgi:hypothetical protein
MMPLVNVLTVLSQQFVQRKIDQEEERIKTQRVAFSILQSPDCGNGVPVNFERFEQDVQAGIRWIQKYKPGDPRLGSYPELLEQCKRRRQL